MALPFVFANVSTLVTSQLDANYNALGALTPIPCSVSGTNTLTLTPLANTPTVSAYSNYMQFTGIAVANNTTAVTAQVGTNGFLSVYKDSQGGPVALSANDIVTNCQFTLIYDLSLNGGAGGFHFNSGGNRLASTGGTVTGPVVFEGGVQFGSPSNASISNVVSASSSLAWANVPANSGTSQVLTLAGTSVGDVVTVGPGVSVPNGLSFFGWVPNAGSVTLQALNCTGASIAPVAGQYRVSATRYTP